MKALTGIIFGINLNFSQPCKGGNVCRGQPRDTSRDMECEKEKERECADKSEKRGRLEQRNKCNLDKRTLLMGLQAHRFGNGSENVSVYRNENEWEKKSVFTLIY